MSRPFDVVGIGNAIMDVISHIGESGLSTLGVRKGIMQLVDRPRSDQLLAASGSVEMVPGGSVANTLEGLGRYGLATAFIGRVAKDTLGRRYAHDTEAAGTAFINPPADDPAGFGTSRSIILVTPDGERSMNTYLGISAELDEADVDPEAFKAGPWLFLEGYLFDKPAGKRAFLKATDYCHANGGLAGIALSDPYCVDRHRTDFRRLVSGPMDYVIGNTHEWLSLYRVEDIHEAMRLAALDCRIAACTRSGDDVILFRDGEQVTVPVKPAVPVDATGAGDQFAAGFIYGLRQGYSLTAAGMMGCIAAAEIISHVGARPRTDVMGLFRSAGLVGDEGNPASIQDRSGCRA